jgi:hypothetical protein
MTPDQWTKIKQIAGEAWAPPELEREAYVRSMCAENEPLRIEVINLLGAMSDAAKAFDRLLIGSVPLVGEDRRIVDLSAADRRPDRPSNK